MHIYLYLYLHLSTPASASASAPTRRRPSTRARSTCGRTRASSPSCCSAARSSAASPTPTSSSKERGPARAGQDGGGRGGYGFRVVSPGGSQAGVPRLSAYRGRPRGDRREFVLCAAARLGADARLPRRIARRPEGLTRACGSAPFWQWPPPALNAPHLHRHCAHVCTGAEQEYLRRRRQSGSACRALARRAVGARRCRCVKATCPRHGRVTKESTAAARRDGPG